MTYSSTSTEVLESLDFSDLNSSDPDNLDQLIVSVKADGRAWAFNSDKNYWYLVDISILKFNAVKPLDTRINNADTTYLLDLTKLTSPHHQ